MSSFRFPGKGKSWLIGVALVLIAPRLGTAAGSLKGRVRELEAALRAQDSATATLRIWCASHHLATDPTIRAERDDETLPPSRETLRLLGSPGSELVRYRHVRLICGDRVLSDAENWYRADRLTSAMNTALETTQTPFGVVVKPLGFYRQTLASHFLPARSGSVLRNKAVLLNAASEPFSVVVETYRRAAVDTP